MGNQLCQATPVHQDQSFMGSQPQLSDSIKDYIKKNKPFQQQLQKQKKVTVSYPDGIYEGPMNFMNNPGGYGTLYKNDGSVFIGHFNNGKADGEGVLIFPDGSYVNGKFNNNMLKEGEYGSQNFKYSGEFKDNVFHGQGHQFNYKQKSQFRGRFEQGRKVQGTMKWKNDKIQYTYEGSFTQTGQFSNGGKLTEESMGFYQGEYKNNRKHGKGTYEYINGIKYVGQYVDGNKEGFGTLYNGDGSVSYEGSFKKGLPHGSGKAYNKEGKSVDGDWVEGINKIMLQS